MTALDRQERLEAGQDRPGLVLSLFPGIGLLDRAFEEEGFCVVRGPDLLWGGDVKAFHPPRGRFDGIIGGPPCQSHSSFTRIILASGKDLAEDLVPEFARCIVEAQPAWWIMENATAVPDLAVEGYQTTRRTWDNRWSGGEQARRRAFQFGTRDGAALSLQGAALDHQSSDTTCLASEGVAGRIMRKNVGGKRVADYKPRRDWGRFCELQGLSPDFLSDSPFTVEGKYRAVGNGVPLPMGRAVARAVLAAASAR